MLADAEPVLASVLLNEALLSYCPHAVAEVVAFTCNVIVELTDMSRAAHASTCEPSTPVIEHAGESPLCESIVQCTKLEVPVPPGSGSLIDAPCAVESPSLFRVTVKPRASPAFTGEASAFFVIVRWGFPIRKHSAIGLLSVAPSG